MGGGDRNGLAMALKTTCGIVREKVEMLTNRAGDFLFLAGRKWSRRNNTKITIHPAKVIHASVSCVLSIRLLVFPAVTPDFVFCFGTRAEVCRFGSCAGVNIINYLPSTYLGTPYILIVTKTILHVIGNQLMERIRHLNALPSLSSPAQVFLLTTPYPYSGDEILDLDQFQVLRDAIEIQFDIFTPEH